MASVIINGPVIRQDENNIVLRGALFHSPTTRLVSDTDYHIIEVGIREGTFTSWVGSWDQRAQFTEGAIPTSILNDGRENMRLRAGQVVVVRISVEGVPATLEGSRVNFRLGRVGGHDGQPKPLVASGTSVEDSNSRVAFAALEKQINTGGLADWEEGVQLHDPVALAPTRDFQGRLQVDSTTEISLQRYVGNWVEVNGAPVSITSDGRSLDTSDGLLTDTGGISADLPQADTLYNVYLGTNGTLALSLHAPVSHLGAKYLGTDVVTRQWRFCGWVYSNSSTQFTDSVTDRLLCNYYNREVLDLYRAPGYVDDDAQTSFDETTTTWAQANGGTGSRVTFLSNAEDAVVFHGTATAFNAAPSQSVEIGLGIDSVTQPARATMAHVTHIANLAIHYSDVETVGYHTADLLVRVSGGTGTYIADEERNGATYDPPMTYISGQVLV